MRFSSTQKGIEYWKAPLDLKTAEFKKPSAKRLANKVNKTRAKSVNETARNSHKYKSSIKK